MPWVCFEVLLNVYEGVLFTWFVTRMQTPKSGSRWPPVLCAILTAAALSSYIFFPMPQWDTWIFVFITAYSLVFFKGSLWQRLFWDMILIIVSGSVVGICYQASVLLAKGDPGAILAPGLPRLVFSAMANFLLWLALFLIARLYPERSLTVRPSSMLLLVDVLCIFQIDLFFRLQAAFGLPVFWLFVGCSVSLVTGIATVVTYHAIVRYEQEKRDYRFMEEMLREMKSRNEDQLELYDSMRRLRHDIHAFMNDARKMLEDGQLDHMPAFLDAIEEKVLPRYSSGNYALDSVLSVKLAKMRKAGIGFRGSNLHYTGGMNIEDYALCSLVSNMLDNAIEALDMRKDTAGERYVYLKFAYTPAGLMIICENPLLGVPPRMADKSFLSQKPAPYHGLGISIMKKTARDAGGRLDIVLADDLFRLLAVIPPRGHSEEATGKGGEHESC